MSWLALSALFEYIYYGSTISILFNSFGAWIEFRRQVPFAKFTFRRIWVKCKELPPLNFLT